METQVTEVVTKEDATKLTVVEIAQTVDRIVKLKKDLDAIKPLYDELDTLTLKLKGLTGVDVELLSSDTTTWVTVTDNFAEKNTAFRPCGVKRFEASLESAAERVERLSKAAKKAEKKAKKGSNERTGQGSDRSS